MAFRDKKQDDLSADAQRSRCRARKGRAGFSSRPSLTLRFLTTCSAKCGLSSIKATNSSPRKSRKLRACRIGERLQLDQRVDVWSQVYSAYESRELFNSIMDQLVSFVFFKKDDQGGRPLESLPLRPSGRLRLASTISASITDSWASSL